MDNIKTFLYWTVGVILTLTIISAGLMLWNKALPIVNSADEQTSRQAKEITDSEFSAYDNQLVSGSQLLTAYRRYSNKDVMFLYIQTINGGTVRNFGMQPNGSTSACTGFDFTSGTLKAGTMACNVTMTQATDNTGSYYIQPQGRFRSTLVRDPNDRITAIYFQQL